MSLYYSKSFSETTEAFKISNVETKLLFLILFYVLLFYIQNQRTLPWIYNISISSTKYMYLGLVYTLTFHFPT